MGRVFHIARNTFALVLLTVALESACSNEGSTGGGGGGSSSCSGSCAPGSTCTINPPPGSAAPSIVCQCTSAGSWCCDGNCDSGTGDAGTDGGAGQAGADSGLPCPAEQCLADAGACVPATGPMGNGTCIAQNGGCFGCRCASPDTPVLTPFGPRAISELRVGDLVYSIDRGELRSVPIVATRRVIAHAHCVVRARLETGVVLEISPGHPTADGRSFGALKPGDRLDGVAIEQVELVGYGHSHTYDILPASDSETYVAGGVLIGSTLTSKPTN